MWNGEAIEYDKEFEVSYNQVMAMRNNFGMQFCWKQRQGRFFIKVWILAHVSQMKLTLMSNR